MSKKHYNPHFSKSKQQYLDNKAAKTKESIICPVCKRLFIKKQYSQAFCCTKCKDVFWNRRGDRHSDWYKLSHRPAMNMNEEDIDYDEMCNPMSVSITREEY